MEKEKTGLKEYISSFKQALIVFIVLYIAFWPMGIDGNSMESAFSDKDRVIMSRIMAAFDMIDRGDIVICNIEHDGVRKDIIKRVVAVPGDHIKIESGKVYINSEEIEEEYINGGITYGTVDILLENGEYFVMGDNREISYDSRNFGVLGNKEIRGRVIFKWYPLNDVKIY